jgi:hypothetical protein
MFFLVCKKLLLTNTKLEDILNESKHIEMLGDRFFEFTWILLKLKK